ncbi:hypothetical protein [Rhizobium phaseoli]|uniref:hypothetical protein n=1 Tax=Rhizobium phaseoli TaxID=396 RepID=UPI0007F11E34|nr:hypothetical protein [Rhizobium phaseoli]ANL38315.1 hypothetical protein AMC89_PD00857 [Rhizobium phaseoli]ANM02019.1 hypothetical protein AMC79_PD00854 [Rhizobium phaseoli]
MSSFTIRTAHADAHNQFHDFCTAASSEKYDETAILLAGNILSNHNAIDSIGICVLHKHFDIRNDEIIVRSRHYGSFLSIARKNEGAQHLKPVSWAQSPCFDEPTGLEYARLSDSDIAYPKDQLVKRILFDLARADLASFFGLVYLPWYASKTEAFEFSDDTIRASVLLGGEALEQPVKASEFAQSVFAFENREGHLKMSEQSRCSINCLNCAPSNPGAGSLNLNALSDEVIYELMISRINAKSLGY